MNLKPFSKDFFASPFQSRIVAVLGTKENFCPVTRHMPFSSDPFLYGIALSKKTFTSTLIQKESLFSLQFFTHEWKDEINFLGKTSGKDVDKIAESGFTVSSSQKIPIIQESFAGMILEKKEVIDFGDHSIIIGEPTHYWTPEEKDITKNKPLLYYGRGRYGEGGDVTRVKKIAL